jgi:hypothetical protein
MSKQNKANKTNYDQAGRLTPDEIARERINQAQISGRAKGKENLSGKVQEHGGQGPTRGRTAREE